MEHRKFLLGDTVKYVGDRIRKLSRRNTAWGTVSGYVKGEVRECVVDFADDAYIVYENELDYYNIAKASQDDLKQVEVVKIARKWDSE